MTDYISKNFSKFKIADVFKGMPAENDLGADILGGFPVIGYKGKVWSIRSRGEEEQLMREDGDGPRSSIDIVILQSAKTRSKVWYEKGWVDGSTAPPDCWSNDAIAPDPSAPKIQSPTCTTCPRNIWGGRITEAGKRAKECGDAKRLAVVMIDDIGEEDVQPMLLRVPAASLADLSAYGAEISKLGHPYFSVVTKVTFDPQESYPRFKFQAIRPLDEEEGLKAIDMRAGPIERILGEVSEAMLVEGATVTPPKQIEKQPEPKVINTTAEVVPPKKSSVKPRKPKQAAAEEVEEAQVVEQPATAAAPEDDEDGEDASFSAALDAKLSKFLGEDEEE